MRLAAILAGGLVLAGLVALSMDMAAARFFLAEKGGLPGDVRKAIGLCEFFGHGAGIVLIAITIFVLDQTCRRDIPRLLAAALGAGVMANLCKMLVVRIRPHALLTQIGDLRGYSVWETFRGWLPGLSVDSTMQSFPSAHAATAAGLAIFLVWRYPHGRWLFVVFALLGVMQRVVSGAHFSSDACWGAALGILVGSLCVHSQLSNRIFPSSKGKPKSS